MEIDQALLVREAERRPRKDGGEYLRLLLGDRTGAVACMVWENIQEIEELAAPGRARAGPGALHGPPALRPPDQPARASGARPRELRRAGSAGRPAAGDLPDGSRGARAHRHDPGAATCARCSSGCSARIPSSGPPTGWRPPRSTTTRPTATACSSTRWVSPRRSARSAPPSRDIDRDVAVTGALLHDIGKLEAYSEDPQSIDLTDAGRLHGEIALGYYRIRREIEDIAGFPPSLRRRSGTSSSPTTARSSTAAPSSPAPGRRRSST